MEHLHYPFPAVPLPYPLDALVPHLNARTLSIHHDKHYENYVNQLNGILKTYPDLQQLTLEQLLTHPDKLPQDAREGIIRNAGGVYNHQLYFAGMGPEGARPAGRMARRIDDTYGSLDGFHKAMKTAAMGIYGSGYAWLVEDEGGNLSVVTTPNQGVPDLSRLRPLLNLDMWEHAYYLQYQNRKDEYIDNWFSIIDWSRFSDEGE